MEVFDPLCAYAECAVNRVEWPYRCLAETPPWAPALRQGERLRNMYLNEYIRRIAQETDGLYDSIYRGHGDRIWSLESAAYRRLKRTLGKEHPSVNDHINYNEQLLEIARLKGLHQKGFRELCDLELLAELQHLGGRYLPYGLHLECGRGSLVCRSGTSR